MKNGLTSREAEVLAAVPGCAFTPSHAVRYVNLDRRCRWCPVGRLSPAHGLPSVPPVSAARMRRVLESLVRKGRVDKIPGFRHGFYAKRSVA